MRRPIEEERVALAEMVKALDEFARAVEEDDFDYARFFQDRIGVAAHDQLLAAVHEATKLFRGSELYRSGGAREQKDVAQITVAVMRCYEHACPHTTLPGRPLVALLGARVIACDDCLPRYLGVIAEQDSRVRSGGDSCCGFCLEESKQFWQVQGQYGPVGLIGDACPACVERYHPDHPGPKREERR